MGNSYGVISCDTVSCPPDKSGGYVQGTPNGVYFVRYSLYPPDKARRAYQCITPGFIPGDTE